MKVALLILALAISGCGQSPLKKAYDARLSEAKADCFAKGGDEFKPYGSIAWFTMAQLGKPMTFRCQKLLKNWKRGIAVYSMHVSANDVILEIR